MRAPHASQLGPIADEHRALPTGTSSSWQILHLLNETQPEKASLHFAVQINEFLEDKEKVKLDGLLNRGGRGGFAAAGSYSAAPRV